MSSLNHQHHLHHQHSIASNGSNLDFLNSAVVSILSKEYSELKLDEDAIMYIKYLIMKIIKILLSGHSITSGHSSTSPLTTASGTKIGSNSIGSSNGTLSSKTSSGSSCVLIRLTDLEDRIKLMFPYELDEAILQAVDKIITDLNSSSSDWTLHREGSLNENSGTLKQSFLNNAVKLSGKRQKGQSRQHKLNKISTLTSAHKLHIPFLSFSHFLREFIGGGIDIKFDPDPDVIVFMMVVIEYIISEILESTGNYVSNIPSKTGITKEDVKISMSGGTVIKSLFNPDDEVNYDHEDAILCLQSNPGSNQQQSSSLCFFSLDLDPKFINKLIENKENEKLSRQQKLLELNPSSLTGITSPVNHDVGTTCDPSNHSSTGALTSVSGANLVQRSSQLFMKQNVTYEDVVKELISEEKFFIRDLQLIIKLFRESFSELMKQQETDSSSLPSSPTSPTTPSLTSSSLASSAALLADQQQQPPSHAQSVPTVHKSFGSRIKESDIRAIFSNIGDIEELSVKLLCSLEDTLEAMISSNLSNDDVTKSGSGNNLSGSNPGSVTSMSKSPIESIGSVFEDFAVDQEFDVYEIFASDIIGNHALYQHNNNNYGTKNNMSNQFMTGFNWSTSPSNQVLQELLSDNMISKPLATAGKGFLQQIKYILPKLLIGIVYHCYTYFNYISILKSLSPDEVDRDLLIGVEGLLKPLEIKLAMMTGITFKSGMKVPVCFGQHFFTLHHPGLTSSTTSPSSLSTGTLNPHCNGQSLSAYHSVTTFGPLISYSLSLSSANENAKIRDLINNIDGIDTSLSSQYMNYLVLDGSLYKSSQSNKSHPKTSERKAFLFDGVFLLCKDVVPPKESKSKLILYGQTKRYLISDIEVVDLPDPPVVYTSVSFSVGSGKDSGYNNSSMVNSPLPGQQLSEDYLGELSSVSAMSLRSSFHTSTTSLISTASNNFIQGSGIGASFSAKSDYVPKIKNAFGIIVRESKELIVLSTDSLESKNLWISNLIFLTSRSSLDKKLEMILLEEDRKNPLQLPSPIVYQFTVPDSESNIIFEENKFNNAGVPLIKAATMAKLVERLTFHLHADPTFVRVFLTTYRSFSDPRELFEYLTERFNIPEIESKAREDVKKFEKDYVKPVQLRVLNVIRHWVDQHFYDFLNDDKLLDDLVGFLDKKAGKQKALKKWVDAIQKNISRARENNLLNNQSADPSLFFNSSPPHFEWHVISAENVSSAPKEMFNLLTIHPIEFARQFTLLEYELFKKVKPSELVDCAWTKKDKEKTSPNLLRFTNFGNNYAYWLNQQIVETENFEERVAVYSRILEIMQVFQELNNFDGTIFTVAALESAAVHRLEVTKDKIPNNLKKSLQEASNLNQGHHKKYFDLLRSINPPCVPFLGKYLTYIVQIHEGNSDETRISVRDELRSYACGEDPVISSSTHTLINFSKRRKVAEITQEIQQYQNTPYCLNPEPHIRKFIESIKPLESDTFVAYLRERVGDSVSDEAIKSMPKDEKGKYFEDYVHKLSLDIEPRKLKQAKKADRKWPELSLKSPGIKPSPAPTFPNSLSRVKGVFASAVATSGLSLSKNSSIQATNNLSDPSYTDQISPNAVTLSFKEKDHCQITLPLARGNSHHHHVRQSSLNQPHHEPSHGTRHHPIAPLTPLPYSSSLNNFSDHAVFANVMIGGVGFGGSSYPPLTPVPSTPLTPGHRQQFSFSNTGSNPPPALPPRRQRLASTTSQSYDESMSSHCSAGSDVTLQPPPRPPHSTTPLLPSTPSTPGSSKSFNPSAGSGHSQTRNIFNFPPPLPPPEATPPVLPPRPDKLHRMISNVSSDQTVTGTAASADPSTLNIVCPKMSPPPLPPRGVQPSLVNRHSFNRGSSSQSLYQTSPSLASTSANSVRQPI